MKVVVNELEGCKRGLEVEVPSEQVVEEVERSFKEYSRHARVPGCGRIGLLRARSVHSSGSNL